MFTASYFRDQIHADVRAMHEPPRIVVTLVSGERFAIHRLGTITDDCIGFFIFPQDGSPLPEIPADERTAGDPRYRADLVVVPYERILDVRMSTAPLPSPQQPQRAIGFDRR